MASWSSIASQGIPSSSHGSRTFASKTNDQPSSRNQPTQRRQKRSPSPAHRPQTQDEDENVYVLTLLTDKRHHNAMTEMRKQYFPKRINKLEAHLTLFHALPESKLESSVIPRIQEIVAHTKPFKVHAAKPFRMKKGMAISVPKNEGGQESQNLHSALQNAWAKEDWLSEQDAGGMRVHYTIMNKVDDEKEVDKAFQEVQNSWKGDWGTAQGLTLYRYEKGFWRWQQGFQFASASADEGKA